MPTDLVTRLEQQATLLDEWTRVRAEINRLEARAAAVLAERADLMDDDVTEQPQHREAIWRSMIAEFSAAGHIARGSAEHAFADARFLASDDHPLLRASFEAGSVSAAHVREIIRAASPVREAIAAGVVAPETMELYETAAVVFAEAEAPARTRTHSREVAAALAGSTINERHALARSERHVSVRSVGDGMALLQVLLPEHLAVAIHDRLTQMARHQKQHPQHREPTLPVDEDALQDKLDNDPRYYEPEDEHQRDEHQSDDVPAAPSEGAIFGDGDTFTRDPFSAHDLTQPGFSQPGFSSLRSPIPPDDDPYGGDPDAYWAHVEAMISAGPEVIQIPADERTLDQIRTDLLTDLLLSADPSRSQGTGLSSITARIQVTVAAETLTGGDDRPAQLDGHGELHPDTARILAGMNNGWTRLFLDPSGMVTETDTYTPTEGMRRFLRARDQHCRFPGCRMPVHRCETDHTHDHAHGGPTAVDNLAHLCKTHHALKHPDIPDEHRWVPQQLPNWDIAWTSPTGRTYTDSPPRRVMFAPSPAASPGVSPSPAASEEWSLTGDAPPWAAD